VLCIRLTASSVDSSLGLTVHKAHSSLASLERLEKEIRLSGERA
jgi:hypothetical protein